MTDEERDKARALDIQRAKEAKAIGVAVLDDFFDAQESAASSDLLAVGAGEVEALVYLQLAHISMQALRDHLKDLINNGQLAEHNRAHDTKH